MSPRLFRRWLSVARRRGERRATRELAAELLGNGRTGERVDRLLRDLPLHVRLGLATGRRLAFAAVVPLVIAVGAAALLLRPPRQAPDAVLVLYYRGSSDSLYATAVPVHRDGWEKAGPIDVARMGAPYATLTSAGNRGDLASSPDGTHWAFGRLVPESAAAKVFVVGPDGKPRQLTDSVRDDYGPSWSPDGRSLVFSTERWNTNRWADLATVDLATRRIRRVTSHPGTETNARWSPDGTRIAFSREVATSSQPEVCWTTPAGDPEVCLPGYGTGLLGWYDANQVLIRLDSAGRSVIARYDVGTGESHALWHGGSTDEVRFSDDGRWVACRCVLQGYDEAKWFIFPTDRPDLARGLMLDARQEGQPVYAVWTGNRTPTFIARIEVEAAADSIPLGSGFQLHIRGWDQAGKPIAVPVLTWRSADTTVATVDPTTGVVWPVREGNVTIVATAGGWRSAQRRFTIIPRASRDVASETWVDMSQWVAFGDPKPVLTTGPQGVRAFLNNGDGWNKSGAHSKRSFEAERGLGMEAHISTPVVGPRQQVVRLSLAAWADSGALARMDGSVDNQPGPRDACHVAYPSETGDNPATRGDLDFGGRLFRLPPELRSGVWYTIRLQVFPDGRCGVAVNGKALAIDDASLALDRPYYAVLEGNSLGNRMLVGPVEVWEGVRDGVKWPSAKLRGVRGRH